MRFIKKLFYLLIFLFFSFSLTKNLFNINKNLSFYNASKNVYDKEKRQNLVLKTEIIKKSDIDEMEKTIRNKLNLSKPNETIIIIPNQDLAPAPLPTPVIPVYKQWVGLFF